jgi:hypothetical protein
LVSAKTVKFLKQSLISDIFDVNFKILLFVIVVNFNLFHNGEFLLV